MGKELRAKLTLKIDGSTPAEDFTKALVQVTVDTNLHMPAMFAIEVYDDKLEFVDQTKFDLGKPVEITIEPPEQQTGTSTATPLIKNGEITSIEPQFNENGRATLLIRGYDKSHRLLRGRQTRTFLKVTDSDMAKTVGGEAGLTVSVDATSTKFDFVLQNNQSNMEFLLERARRIGYNVFVDQGTLYFKKGAYTLTATSTPELTWLSDLRSFRPRMSGVQQTDKAVVTGWDFKAKKEVKGQASATAPANQGGITKAGGAAAKSAFGGAAKSAIVNSPIGVASVATDLATALIADVQADFVQAEGECFGDPRIKAGIKIKISGVGTRFSGNYLVTAATHVYRSGKYVTSFTTGGHEAYTVSALVGGGPGRGRGWHSEMSGVVIGLVTNQKDPDNLGRVKVKFPWLKDAGTAEIESDWVRIASPMAGKDRGLMFMPEINDEVLIAFEHGDVHAPYILGSLWNSKDPPPLANNVAAKDGKVEQRILKTRVGHMILLDDTSGKEKIVIQDKTTKNEIVIDSAKNTLTINVDKDVAITAKGNMTFKASGDMVLDGKNVTIKALQNLTMKATQNAEIKATSNVVIEATAQLNLKGTASASLKNAVASIALSGPTVNINNGALEVM